MDLGNSKVQGVLVSSLISEKYDTNNEKSNMNVVFQPNDVFYSSLVEDKNKKEESDDEIDSSNNELKEKDIFVFIKDPINSFFIGSITVVGLFVLFRLLNKNK